MNSVSGASLVLMAVLAAAAAPASAAERDDSPDVWLEKMTRVGQTLSYRGTFVYRRNDQLVAVNILHVADERGGREQLVALNGTASEIVRSCDGAVCFLPRRKSIIVNKLKGRHTPDSDIARRIDDLQDHYRFTLAGDERVAGRAARAMIIEPADNYRFGYRIWIDRDTGLLLKSDMVGNDGTTVEQIMFTNLDIIESPTEDMLTAVDQTRFAGKPQLSGNEVIFSDEAADVASESWRVDSVPDGFKPVEHFRHHRTTHGETTEHMIFTDGLASVSVFIEKAGEGDTLLSGFSSMGAVNVFGTLVGNHHITVVGEVPTMTVRLIGESVRQISIEPE